MSERTPSGIILPGAGLHLTPEAALDEAKKLIERLQSDLEVAWGLIQRKHAECEELRRRMTQAGIDVPPNVFSGRAERRRAERRARKQARRNLLPPSIPGEPMREPNV